ncbi:DNA helicase [Malassezia cuniculi]|uniref:DNA 3'-5' helicase n=1 Tax=Malassezia cuniculi TaxID=948313 RepID=A0AAF0J8E0_9BASI|nr:DNA helicase [Malassezia cuniculi]
MTLAACLASLTEAQRRAVTCDPSIPLQILAGPGSGKTKVLTSRAAWLVSGGSGTALKPENCVVVTFTNKAANEMRTRLEALIGAQTSQLVLGTFHATCVRLLRRHGSLIGIPANFTIADRDSAGRTMRRVFEAYKGDADSLTPDGAVAQISAAKARGLSPRMFALGPGAQKPILAALYRDYQVALREENALDFDDILLCGAKLVREHNDTVSHIQHVLVDEFQDTNRTQYELMTHLAALGSITIVGDPDQSIYGWRCAETGNLERMKRDYPDTQLVYLEQNFRSTGAVLASALQVVQQDTGRIDKGLFTSNSKGVPVTFRRFSSSDDEAEFVALEIQRMMKLFSPALSHADFAVLFRSNAQSRTFESAFQQAGIPYRLVGTARFFDRTEVKDLLAYLLVADNQAYTTGLVRIANVPRRGIGAKTLEDLRTAASSSGKLLLHVMEEVADGLPEAPVVRGAAVSGIKDLVHTLRTIRRAACEDVCSADLLRLLIKQVKFEEHLRRGDEFESRWDNVQELINFAAAVDRESVSTASMHDAPAPSLLRALLESGALATEEQSDDTPKVTLSTCHGAKGLEWPVVFVIAAEDGSMPLYRATTAEEINEERRLLYVAMTRAATNLYISCSTRRMSAGQFQSRSLSPFLQPLVPHAHGGTCQGKSDWCYTLPSHGLETLEAMSAVLARKMPAVDEFERRMSEWSKSRQGMRLAELGAQQRERSQSPERKSYQGYTPYQSYGSRVGAASGSGGSGSGNSNGFVSAINTMSANVLNGGGGGSSSSSSSTGVFGPRPQPSGAFVGVLGAFRNQSNDQKGTLTKVEAPLKRPADSANTAPGKRPAVISAAMGAKHAPFGAPKRTDNTSATSTTSTPGARRPRLGVGRARKI